MKVSYRANITVGNWSPILRGSSRNSVEHSSEYPTFRAKVLCYASNKPYLAFVAGVVTSLHFWLAYPMGRVHISVQRKPSGKVFAVGRKAGMPGNGDWGGNMNRVPAAFVVVDTHFLVIRV